MTRKCRVTVRRDGRHTAEHQIRGKGGNDRHFTMSYTIKDNQAHYVIAGRAPLQTNDVSVYINAYGKENEFQCNNPTTGRPDATFLNRTVSFSEGDEYTWAADDYRLKVRRGVDSDDFKEFEITILPVS